MPATYENGPAEDPGAAAARLTGRPVTGLRPLSGTLAEVVLDGGQVVMVKRGSDPGAALAEAAGLRWLAAAGTVRVPAVLSHDPHWLVTEHIPTGPPSTRAATRLGQGLAALHTAGAPAYGAPPPGGPEDAYIGLAPMRNVPGPDWPLWYAEHRVLPYLRRAVDDGTMRSAEAAMIERVCERLPELAGPAEPPARLHGDLWNGNVLWGADGQAWLIDPAAHGGHRETEPGDAPPLRLPAPGPRTRRLPADRPTRRRLASTHRPAPALPPAGPRGPLRPRLRRTGPRHRPRDSVGLTRAQLPYSVRPTISFT